MPFLPDESSTDKLLKHLGINLFQQFGAEELRNFGWFQYRDYDHLKTLVSTEFAAHAFLYLSLDANGSWRRNVKVITVFLAFMARYYRDSPSLKELVHLKELIVTQPVDQLAIINWFHAAYPPDAAPE